MKKLKFFIVDDTEYIRFILRKMLNASRIFEAEIIGEASDGLDAIRQLKILKPDIITLDITMPRMNGLEAVKIIREMLPDVKILMVTVLGDKNKVLTAVQNGANGYMLKPFKQEKVFKTIKELFGEEFELSSDGIDSSEREPVLDKKLNIE